jgi:hypothetical protein
MRLADRPFFAMVYTQMTADDRISAFSGVGLRVFSLSYRLIGMTSARDGFSLGMRKSQQPPESWDDLS